MKQHWFKRSGYVGVVSALLLTAPTALAVGQSEDFTPPPGDFWGHVDIPEIGIGGGGKHKTDDTKNTDPFGAFTTGDDLLGLRLSNWSTSLKNGAFAITPNPSIGISVTFKSGSVLPKSLFSGKIVLPITPGISSKLRGPSSFIGASSQPTSGSAIPTPGAGVLLIGGLALLSSRRRRPA